MLVGLGWFCSQNLLSEFTLLCRPLLIDRGKSRFLATRGWRTRETATVAASVCWEKRAPHWWGSCLCLLCEVFWVWWLIAPAACLPAWSKGNVCVLSNTHSPVLTNVMYYAPSPMHGDEMEQWMQTEEPKTFPVDLTAFFVPLPWPSFWL